MKKFFGLALVIILAVVGCDKDEDITPVNIVDDKVIEITIGDDAYQLNAGIEAEDLVWTASSDALVVNKEGKVTAIKAADVVNVVVKSESNKYTKTFTVKVLDILTTEIVFEKEEMTVEPGEEFKIIATITPENSTQPIEWSTSDKDVAIVDAEGNVTIACDLTESKDVVITAKSGEITASLNIHVFVFVEPADDAKITISFEKDLYQIEEEYNAENAKIKLNISPLCTLDEDEYLVKFVIDMGWQQQSKYWDHCSIVKDEKTHEYYLQIDASINELDFSDLETSYYITLEKVRRLGHDEYIVPEYDQSLKIDIKGLD